MSLKLKLTLIIVLILFLFPRQVNAEEKGHIYYKSTDVMGEELWETNEVEFCEDFDENEKAFFLFTEMFENPNKFCLIPEGARVLTVVLNDKHLTLNMSKEIMGYGEKYYQENIKEQIIKTALNIPNVDKVTLLIDNSQKFLTEGSYNI